MATGCFALPAVSIFALALASAGAASPPATNQPLPLASTRLAGEKPPHRNVRQGRLENGLRYYLVQTDDSRANVAIQFYVLAGWGRESPSENGLSHLLEHAAVESNERFPGASFYRYLASKGLSSTHFQASVGDTYTTYSLDLPRRDSLDPSDAVSMIEQWASKVLLTPEIFEAQRRVVAAEASGGAESPAERYARSAGVLLGFQNNFLLRPMTANQSLARASVSDARQFYTRWYVPQQQVVVAVGAIDLDAYEQAIRTQLGKLETAAAPKSAAFPSQRLSRENRIVIQDDKEDRISASIVYLRERRRQSVADSLLTEAHDEVLQALLSKLARREMITLSSKMPAASPAIAFVISRPAMRQPNKFDGLEISLATKVSGRFEQVLTAGRQLLQSSIEGFTDAELDEIKKDIRTSSAFSNRNAASEIGSDLLGEILRSGDVDATSFLRKRDEALDRVTLASFRSYWADWAFGRQPSALVTLDRARFSDITEKSVEAALAKSPAKKGQAPVRSAAWPTPSETARAPHFQETILPSGQKICRGSVAGHDILVAPRSSASNSNVRVTAYSRSGYHALNPDLWSASRLSAGYFRMFGMKEYTAADLNALAEAGNFRAQFQADSGSTRFDLSGPETSLDAMFRYLAAVGSSHAAPSDPLIERELVDALEAGIPPEEGIFAEVRRAFPEQFFFATAQPASANPIKARAIASGLDALIGKMSNFGFVVTGAADCDAVGKTISGYFVSEPAVTTDPSADVPATAEFGMPKALTKDGGKGEYADVTIVLPLTIQNSAQEIAAADILRQAIYLRVRGVLREEQSKVYAVIVNSESRRWGNDKIKRKIVIKYSVAPDLLEDTLGLAKKEISRVRTALPPEDARLAANQVEEEYRRSFDSPAEFHRQVVRAAIFGEPILDISEQLSAVQNIVPQVRSIADRLLRDDQVYVFIEK